MTTVSMLSLSSSAYNILYLRFSLSESHSVTSVHLEEGEYCHIKTVSKLSLSN